MPQLATGHIFFDTLLLFLTSFLGFSGVCYSTCTTASCYFNAIAKYIINIHCALNYFIKIK